MKQTYTRIICVVALLVLLVSVSACQSKAPAASLWETAQYTEDTSLGEGSKTLSVTVQTPEKAITFTVKTEAETVGEALTELGLIDGEQGPYGLYVKKVNGIVADYDIDQSYWSFAQNGEALLSGVDTTSFADGAQFEFVYVK